MAILFPQTIGMLYTSMVST